MITFIKKISIIIIIFYIYKICSNNEYIEIHNFLNKKTNNQIKLIKIKLKNKQSNIIINLNIYFYTLKIQRQKLVT